MATAIEPAPAPAAPVGASRNGTGMFNYDHLELRYDPFPIGLAKPLVEADRYAEMLANYPDQELFAYLAKVGHKYSLSEKSNPKAYHDFVQSKPIWRDFHAMIKSDAFVKGVVDALAERHVDLGYGKLPTPARRTRKFVRNLLRGRLDAGRSPLSARFEYSMLPADGGYVIPHTDSPGKVITMVVSMVGEGEWDQAIGGGTDLNKPKDPALTYNELNRQARFDEMDVIDTFEFTPNQGVIFVKTFNSWHSVRPMTGKGSKLMRKTLTINIESYDN
jgi:hypothetical protein